MAILVNMLDKDLQGTIWERGAFNDDMSYEQVRDYVLNLGRNKAQRITPKSDPMEVDRLEEEGDAEFPGKGERQSISQSWGEWGWEANAVGKGKGKCKGKGKACFN